jgi:hypothetical protein
MVERLGRHCLLVHESLRSKARACSVSEPVVLDGLGSFAGGQYWPFELTNLVGAKSYYSHDFSVTEQRRRGRMRPDQRMRREHYERRLGKPAPGALKRDVLDVLRYGLPEATAIVLRTDEKSEYGWALKRLESHAIERRTTHSKKPRTPRNPLFAINSHHMFMRHSEANHKRETIAFSKRLQGAIYRYAIFQAWNNLIKWASERNPGTTAAQRLGVVGSPWSYAKLLNGRRFVTRMEPGDRVAAYYAGAVRSRFCRGERGVEQKFAY